MVDLRKGRVLALSAVVALVLSACGGAKVADSSAAAPADSKAECGTVNIAVNPWVGYEANAAVVGYVAQSQLGCTVVKKNLKEEISWQGFATGEVDAVLENWGHDDLIKKYITEQNVAVDFGATGNNGIIGWYVAPWMAEKYPDILDAVNLNKYADLFKNSESGGKGAFFDGDPSYVTTMKPL